MHGGRGRSAADTCRLYLPPAPHACGRRCAPEACKLARYLHPSRRGSWACGDRGEEERGGAWAWYYVYAPHGGRADGTSRGKRSRQHDRTSRTESRGVGSAQRGKYVSRSQARSDLLSLIVPFITAHPHAHALTRAHTRTHENPTNNPVCVMQQQLGERGGGRTVLRISWSALRAVLNHGLATRSWRAGRWPPRPASTTQRRRRGRCMSSTPTSRTSPAACR